MLHWIQNSERTSRERERESRINIHRRHSVVTPTHSVVSPTGREVLQFAAPFCDVTKEHGELTGCCENIAVVVENLETSSSLMLSRSVTRVTRDFALWRSDSRLINFRADFSKCGIAQNNTRDLNELYLYVYLMSKCVPCNYMCLQAWSCIKVCRKCVALAMRSETFSPRIWIPYVRMYSAWKKYT